LLFPALAAAAEQLAYTPKAGSPERVAICDAAREYVLRKYANRPLPQPIVFKIEHMAVQEPYCNVDSAEKPNENLVMKTRIR
jgi:hypothetical protein